MYDIVNVKFSFQLHNILNIRNLLKTLDSVVHHSNYSVIRPKHRKIVFIVFYSGYVNCTGLKTQEDIPAALALFQEVSGPSNICFGKVKIDNIAATSHLGKKISLTSLKPPRGEVTQVCYNPERFAGAHVKLNKGGCCIVFENGKVVLVGAKSDSYLRYMLTALQDVLPS